MTSDQIERYDRNRGGKSAGLSAAILAGLKLPALILVVASLSLSTLTTTARANLFLGPQTPILGGAGIVAGALTAIFAWRYVHSRNAVLLDRPVLEERLIFVIAAACAVLSLVIFRFAFEAFPNSADEHGFLFEAATFLKGRLSNPPPPDPELFRQQYVVAHDGIWVSQYLPGWPAVLTLLTYARLPPYLATPLCGALLLLALWGTLRLECASRSLRVALLLAYATTAFFLLNSATYFSHCVSALMVVGAVQCLLRAGGSPDWRWPVAAGAFAGAAFLCRIDGGSLALVAAAVAWAQYGFRTRMLFLGALGLLPPMVLFALYNTAITGSAFTPPAVWAGNLTVGAGGITGVEVGRHFRVLSQTLWRLGELADTASLVVPALYLSALALRLRARQAKFYDVVPIANFVLFAIFPDLGGFQMGPRYWFDGFAVMHITIGSAFAAQPETWRRFATACCLLVVPVSLARLPAQVYYQARVMNERATIFRLVEHLPPAMRTVVLVNDFPSMWNYRNNRTHWNGAEDFIRNGPDFDRSRLLYAHGDAPDALVRVCHLYPDAAIFGFRLDWTHPNGSLQPLHCTN
ncbi:MAG: hypothetical protein JWM91_4130 [Rhodospirillales bacterium]|nr:hypothetical protein [Rhodospirillales bacterium]